ncbi:MAG TPA: DUF222 domain-containing protein [Candidatus Dormibacteraeota bacterium]|jgi:hypothetical protein
MFPPLLDPAHDTLADDICGLSAHIAAAQAELAAKTARFNATMAWAEGGIRSCAEFLSQNAGLDLGTGHDLIGVGDALDRLPLLAEACAAGELSFDKARAVASVATEVDQEMWVELARQCTGSQVVRICRGVRRAMAAAEPEQGRRHQALRGVIQTWRDDGMVRLVALLAPEDGALVLAALEAVTCGKPVPEDDPAEDRWAANRGDALVAICENALAKAPEDLASSPASTRLVVVVDAGVLTGEEPGGICELEGGRPLSRSLALRLGCDCRVSTVTTRDGLPIDAGRTTRSISPRLSNALRVRDKGCLVPGCGAPASRTEGHHLIHWALGGPTDLENLASLCKYHHRRHHMGDFRIERPPGGEFRFVTAAGRELTARRTSIDPTTGGPRHLKEVALSRGAPILPLAPAAQDGYAVNVDYAISVMCDASAYARRNADSAS